MPNPSGVSSRRQFLGSATATVAGVAAMQAAPGLTAAQPAPDGIVRPPEGKPMLLACKLGMIAKEEGGTARAAVRETRVFVHGAINHDHWNQRLTSAVAADRDKGRANLEHCVRLSHAAGGSGVLLVVGRNTDGPEAEIEERARQEIRSFGHRCMKLDIKGRSRAAGKGADITSELDDVPWDQVRRALKDIGWSGWATAEVGGGGLDRLTLVRQQMQKALGLGTAG